MLRIPGKLKMTLRKCLVVQALGLTLAVIGCSGQSRGPLVVAPYPALTTIAVAPVLNFSGTQDLDTLKVTDILFGELQQVDGLAVIPVNRVLAQMAQDGIDVIESPQQALELAERLGVQAIIVTAITEYDPYFPPKVGLAMQLYGLDERADLSGIDTVKLQRRASPMQIKVDLEKRYWPKSQVQRRYDGRDDETINKVKQFARERGTGHSPYGWEVYVRTQQDYLRFVCHEAISELMEREKDRMNQTFLSDAVEYN